MYDDIYVFTSLKKKTCIDQLFLTYQYLVRTFVFIILFPYIQASFEVALTFEHPDTAQECFFL